MYLIDVCEKRRIIIIGIKYPLIKIWFCLHVMFDNASRIFFPFMSLHVKHLLYWDCFNTFSPIANISLLKHVYQEFFLLYHV